MAKQNHFSQSNGKAESKQSSRSDLKGLKTKTVDDYIRFVVFLAVIGMAYIWNSHYAVRQVRKMDGLKKEAKDLKSKYLLKRSTLSAGTRLSEIRDVVDNIGLYRPTEPVYKLVRGKNMFQEPLPRLMRTDSVLRDSILRADTLLIDTLYQDSLMLRPDSVPVKGQEVASLDMPEK